MASETEIMEACSLLETDVLRHIVALKMIRLYGPECGLVVRRDGRDWGLLALLPVARVSWDRRNYPGAAVSVFIEGSRPESALAMLDAVPRGRVVVKTAEPDVGRFLAGRGAKHAVSILTFTADRTRPAPERPPEVESADSLDEEALRFFAENDYEPEELAVHFSRGAARFFIREAGKTVAACFVFENYGSVWEVGGVRTVPESRGRGLAKKTVRAALRFLVDGGRVPRYQTTEENAASIAVARSVGLAHFLTQEHFVWDQSSPRRRKGKEE